LLQAIHPQQLTVSYSFRISLLVTAHLIHINVRPSKGQTRTDRPRQNYYLPDDATLALAFAVPFAARRDR
jgi:hypothetical protein